jgi:hypothetical protein
MNTVEVKAALKAKDAEIRSLGGGKELQKTIDKLRKTVEKLDSPKAPRAKLIQS